jgi:hypothetical protein
MNLRRWTVVAALATGILIIGSGCGRVSLGGGASPTSPPTRTPRPTFTPRSEDTATDVPTDTPAATDTSVPTNTTVPPKKKAVATARPRPTLPPAPTTIPPTAGPTKSPYQYLFDPLACNPSDPNDGGTCNVQNGIKCKHSGGHWIDVFVASNYLDNTSVIAGIHVRYAFTPGGPKIDPDELTGGDGKAEKTLSSAGDPGGKNVGTYYAWVVDSSGNQLSDFSPAIVINDKADSDPKTCWIAVLAFAGGH